MRLLSYPHITVRFLKETTQLFSVLLFSWSLKLKQEGSMENEIKAGVLVLPRPVILLLPRVRNLRIKMVIRTSVTKHVTA